MPLTTSRGLGPNMTTMELEDTDGATLEDMGDGHYMLRAPDGLGGCEEIEVHDMDGMITMSWFSEVSQRLETITVDAKAMLKTLGVIGGRYGMQGKNTDRAHELLH